MITNNFDSILRCFLLFISIVIFLSLYYDSYLITSSNYSQKKKDIIWSYPQDTMRLDIPPPVHGKSLLILHIGPYKTGTTSIQNVMANLDVTGILPKDNFYYLGKVNHEVKEFPTDRDLINPLLWKGIKSWFNPKRKVYNKSIDGFKQRFHKFHASQNHNVFASGEELSDAINLNNTTFFEALKQMIPVDKYDVHFVMMYRRYFEQILSSYHYLNQPRWFEIERWNRWPCRNRSSSCGKFYTTFREFFHETINPRPGKWDPHPNEITSLSVYQSFQHLSPKNWSINVLNMHHRDPSSNVVVDFFCGMGNVTANTCKYVQDMSSADVSLNKTHANVDPLKKNEDKYLIEYGLMAQRAHSIGSVHKNITRRQAELAFQGMFRKWKEGRHVQVHKEGDMVVSSWNGDQDMTIPLACLSRKEQNDILKESENIESNLQPAFYNSINGKESLRRQYQKIEADHAFCNIALVTLFQNDTYWVDFLDCLHKSALVQECYDENIDVI